MTPSRRATPSARPAANTIELGAPDDLNAFRGVSLAALLGAALWAGLLTLALGCATPNDDMLRAYDRAAAMKLAAERPVMRPYARVNDGAPWSQRRVVEIDK